MHVRSADDLRLEDARRLPPPIRRRGGGPAPRRRRRHRRQDEHGRVCHGGIERELRLRAGPQPVGSDPGTGRLQRWISGVRGCRHGTGGDRLRHRRLDPAAGRPVRDHRPEADLRPGEPEGAGGLRVEPRSDRPDGPLRRRLCAPSRDDRRPRSRRRHLARPPRPRLRHRSRAAAGGGADRPGAGALRGRSRPRGGPCR